MKIKYLFPFLMIFFLITSCSNSGDSPQSSEKNKNQEAEPQEQQNESCNCNYADADGVASKIIREFTRRQNELESQDAKIIKLDRLEKRPDCSWTATFEISYPFGNTDGWHPSEFLRKRFKCDGKEIYTY